VYVSARKLPRPNKQEGMDEKKRVCWERKAVQWDEEWELLRGRSQSRMPSEGRLGAEE